jgi:hypothetical protein
MATESAPYDPNNPYEPRHKPQQRKWYQTPYFLIGGTVLLLILILMATGNLKLPGSDKPVETDENASMSEIEQLAAYIVEQRKAGLGKGEIVERMKLSDYSDEKIQLAFDLSSPTIQFILEQQRKGVPKSTIIEELLKQGHTPEEIGGYFATIEEAEGKGLGETLKENWWIIALGIAAIAIIYKTQEVVSSKKAPKVYTLEECREYAEDLLKEKQIDHNPTTDYRNRPELKQYRYVYEEPIYPEFNNGRPVGFKSSNRQYYLIGIGYDKELLEFKVTEDDTIAKEFLTGKPKNYEANASREYMRLRERSEMPIDKVEEQRRSEMPTQRYQPYRRRTPTRRRYSPGPIEGYEDYP